MADSSLVPERQLVFSPGLAATIGLEEAILLQQVSLEQSYSQPSIRRGLAWFTMERERLLQQLPFWSAIDLHRILRSLVDKGVILVDSPPIHSHPQLVVALNEPVTQPGQASSVHAAGAREPVAAAPAGRAAARLPENWSPGENLLQLLALNHNIPRQFALDQLEDFIFYWRERGDSSHAWENKFRQHVTARWRRAQQDTAEQFKADQQAPLDGNWRPSADAMDIMLRDGIAPDFIEQTIPEFVLYWRERKQKPEGLNSKFIQHIRLQWTRYTSGLKHSTEPTRISDTWQPGPDVFEILALAHIDAQFARSLVPEFVMYWRESNQLHTSWNSKFLQHVKYQWARRHQLANTSSGNDGQDISGTRRTRDTSLAEDLGDTSWAE